MFYKRPVRVKDVFLAHHGVKGQKWGVQNGPPYPLDESISTGKSLRDTEEQQKRNYKRLTNTNLSTKNIEGVKNNQKISEEIINESEGLTKAKNEVLNSKAGKDYKEFKENEDMYFDLAGQYLADKSGYPDEWESNANRMKYDDLNDPYGASGQAMYLADKGYSKKDYKSSQATLEKWQEACKQVADKALGKYGNKPLDWFKDRTSKEELLWAIYSDRPTAGVDDFTGFVINCPDSVVKDMQSWLKKHREEIGE